MRNSPAVTREGGPARVVTPAGIFIAWTLFGCVGALQDYLTQAMKGDPMPFWAGLALQLPPAWIWALYTPLILRLAHRFPLRGAGWPRRLLLHVGISTLLVLVTHVAFAFIQGLFPGQTGPLVERTLRVFVLWVAADSMLYWVVLAIGHVEAESARVAETARHEAAMEKQLARARLDALTLRLQPHFLFNSLHAISALVLESPRDANRMITRLSDLLRLTLNRTRSSFVPLDQELDLLGHYIALQELRFGDHLSIKLTVSPDVGNAEVPALLLQPIVENAVRHAIGEGGRAARVDVFARRSANRLHLEVQDNGPGFEKAGTAVEEGEGLRNTRERLREAYGADQSLTLAASPSGGASVTITLPIGAGENPIGEGPPDSANGADADA
jgi:two-component system, LytTR family, sensor kinase